MHLPQLCTVVYTIGNVPGVCMPFLNSHRIRKWLPFAPPVAVLCAATIFSIIYDAPSTALEFLRVPVRFSRFALLLSVPLLVLPRLYTFVVRRATNLLQVEIGKGPRIGFIKHSLFRPFQGIGIGLLFGTKLLGVLQLVAGPSVASTLLLPQGGFRLGRFLAVTLITVLVSLVLSIIWALDDLGIRYFNRRDQEVKMIGKYLGTVMPVIFGFFGIAGFLVMYSAWDTLLLSCRIVIVLYPPMAVFAVLHAYFVNSRSGLFLRARLPRGVIRQEE